METGFGMHIQVGSVAYDVVPCDERLYFNRQEVLSICEHDEQELLLSVRVTPRLLPRVLAEAQSRIERHLATASELTAFED